MISLRNVVRSLLVEMYAKEQLDAIPYSTKFGNLDYVVLLLAMNGRMRRTDIVQAVKEWRQARHQTIDKGSSIMLSAMFKTASAGQRRVAALEKSAGSPDRDHFNAASGYDRGVTENGYFRLSPNKTGISLTEKGLERARVAAQKAGLTLDQAVDPRSLEDEPAKLPSGYLRVVRMMTQAPTLTNAQKLVDGPPADDPELRARLEEALSEGGIDPAGCLIGVWSSVYMESAEETLSRNLAVVYLTDIPTTANVFPQRWLEETSLDRDLVTPGELIKVARVPAVDDFWNARRWKPGFEALRAVVPHVVALARRYRQERIDAGLGDPLEDPLLKKISKKGR